MKGRYAWICRQNLGISYIVQLISNATLHSEEGTGYFSLGSWE